MAQTKTKPQLVYRGIASPETWRYEAFDMRGTPLARRHNESLLASACYGLEVTVPTLSERCMHNLDPQHLGGDSTTAAIEAALSAPLPPDRATLVTVRPDLDSVGAMAVLKLRASGVRLTPAELGNITIIAMSDKFTKGPWPGPRPLPRANQLSDDQVAAVEDNSYLAALAAGVADYSVPLADRVAWVAAWIRTGQEPTGYREQWVAQRRDLARALHQGAVRVRELGNHQLAVVESRVPAPHSLGYHRAPVVIGYNPEYRVQGGPPHPKFTICQWPDRRRIDLRSVFAELGNREPGWGGSDTIGGSPQGKASLLPLADVLRVVRKHLITR